MTAQRGGAEFDLHGVVGIRLVDASAAEVGMVERQIGPLHRHLKREPDITIQFVDELPIVGPLRLIGLDDAGFDDRSFIVLRGRHKTRTRIALPLDQAGGPCLITCERGATAIPHLIALINMAALSRDVIPLHASAVEHEGIGILVTGWAKGGKTETLLSFMARGARYVGDEWIYLRDDGAMLGIPEPIKVWDWHLADLPQFRRRVRTGARLRARSLARLANAAAWTAAGRPFRGSSAGRLAARAAPFIRNQTYLHSPPVELFGDDRCVLEGSVDRVLLLVSRDRPDIEVEPIDGDDLADRMAISNQHERSELTAAYLKLRFAFPQRRNALLEEALAHDRAALASRFAGRRCHVVYHPYPVRIPALFDAIWPAIRGGPTGPKHRP